MTTFATGLNFPLGMAELPDGSMLVATSNNNFFSGGSGNIIRLADTDDDGVADVQTTVATNVLGGALSSLKVAGDLVFTIGQGKPISIYRLGQNPTDPLTFQGNINISFGGGSWLHPHSALGVRETPDVPGSYDLLFQIGSKTNFDDTLNNAFYNSTIGVSGQLAGDAIHMVRITDNGTSVTGSNVQQIATRAAQSGRVCL